MRRFAGLAASILALVSSSDIARADIDADRATARQLANEGEDALYKKDFATAADKFSRADQLFHAPSLVVNLARAHVGLGKLVEAEEEYTKVTLEDAKGNATYARAIADAKRELKALEPRIPWVVLALDGPGAGAAKVTLDKADFPRAAVGVKRAVDPGHHVFRASAPNGPITESAFDASEGAVSNVTLTIEAAPPTPAPVALAPVAASSTGAPTAPSAATATSSSSETRGKIFHIAGYSLVGLGLAGLAVGGIGGGVAVSKASTLSSDCNVAKQCPKIDGGVVSDYGTFATMSTVGIALGAASLAGGVVLLVLAPSSSKSTGARVAPFVAAGRAGVAGSF